MKQPFCAPSEALRRVLDAAAALPSAGGGDGCRWTMPVGRIAARDPVRPGWTSRLLTGAPSTATPCTAPTRPGPGAKLPVTLPVVMKLYAGDAPAAALPAGCAARIMTGAPLPAGADCVLMQELTDGGEDAGAASTPRCSRRRTWCSGAGTSPPGPPSPGRAPC